MYLIGKHRHSQAVNVNHLLNADNYAALGNLARQASGHSVWNPLLTPLNSLGHRYRPFLQSFLLTVLSDPVSPLLFPPEQQLTRRTARPNSITGQILLITTERHTTARQLQPLTISKMRVIMAPPSFTITVRLREVALPVLRAAGRQQVMLSRGRRQSCCLRLGPADFKMLVSYLIPGLSPSVPPPPAPGGAAEEG